MKTGNEYIDSLVTWDDFKKTLNLTPEEEEEINLNVEIASKIIDARQSQDAKKKALRELNGIEKTSVSKHKRKNRNHNEATLSTVLKILRPFGKTLAVVDLPEQTSV